MDVENIFHMKGGHDETSYSRNSSLQKKASDMVKHITLEAIQEVYMRTTPEILAMADLGCSSGLNSLSMIKDLYQAVEDAYRTTLINGPKSSTMKTQAKLSSVSVYLNDLPTNDFNSIFRALPEFFDEEKRGHLRPSLFVAASPGSFYDPIFPPNFLHFIYSSYSLHWLSKIPAGIYDENGKSMNKGCIYICERSPQTIIRAYAQQFREDFSRFLRLRSQELTPGGSMVLVFLGREGLDHIDRGNSFLWELLARSFTILISKGEIEEEKLNSYDVHFYAPSQEEIEEEVGKEGSFKLVHLEKFQIEREKGNNGISYGVAVASTVRAIQESMISHHFGQHILNSLFDTYAHLVDEEMSKQEIRPITCLLVLNKI
ncbi:probable methyltransferase TCM_000336 [Amaranthus tricolor]|uniref:probable methyltransferase TCM_000336 n=1 Tax=Amaranthus tricolor TaxID=29722 RepID=UPI002586EFDA|nr:probable methyltransferase TCM_000336 [Amaranthus tricolor]